MSRTDCPACGKTLSKPDACSHCEWQRGPASTDKPPPRLHDELARVAAECRDKLDTRNAWPAELSRVPERTVSDFLALVEPQEAGCRLVSVNGSNTRWDCPGIVTAAAMLRMYLLGGERLRRAVAFGKEHGIYWRGETVDDYRRLVRHVQDNPWVRRQSGEDGRSYGKRVLSRLKAVGDVGQALPYDPRESLSGDPVGGSRVAVND